MPKTPNVVKRNTDSDDQCCNMTCLFIYAVRNVCDLVGRGGRRTWSTRVVCIAIITQQLHQQQAANQEGVGEEKFKTTKMAKNWYKV
jgi:hypothetical protein